jgi:hypothetical protein
MATNATSTALLDDIHVVRRKLLSTNAASLYRIPLPSQHSTTKQTSLSEPHSTPTPGEEG